MLTSTLLAAYLRIPMRYLPILFAILAFQAKAQLEPDTLTVTMEPYLQVVPGPQFKDLTLTSREHPSVDRIDGFEFEWGYRYVLLVKQSEWPFPPRNASSTRYELLKEISRTEVPEGYTFPLRIVPEIHLGPGQQTNTLVALDDSTYRYMGRVNIHVPEEFREEFGQITGSKTARNGTFRILGHGLIGLVSWARN